MSILSTHMNSLLDGQAWLPAHKQEQTLAARYQQTWHRLQKLIRLFKTPISSLYFSKRTGIDELLFLSHPRFI